jgi:hypothetical protein
MSAARILLRTIGMLARGEEVTTATISARIPCCRDAAAKVLRKLREEKVIRVVAWERSGQVWMARYAWGTGHDVVKPRGLTRHEKWLAQKNDPAYEQQHRAATARYRERQRAATRPPPNLLEIVMPTFRMRQGGSGMTTRVHRLSNKEDDEE